MSQKSRVRSPHGAHLYFNHVIDFLYFSHNSICGRVVKAPDSSSGQLCWREFDPHRMYFFVRRKQKTKSAQLQKMGTMGIEPMTNGLLDQRSTDWAMRPDKCWKRHLVGWIKLKKCKLVGLTRLHSFYFGFDHINRNAPVLIRTPKLTRFEPAQYWGGGPPGNSVVLNPIFFDFFREISFFGATFCQKPIN